MHEWPHIISGTDMKGCETSGTRHNLGLVSVSNCVNTYPFQVWVIMIRLGERMTIKLRKNIMFRGLQRWDGFDKFT